MNKKFIFGVVIIYLMIFAIYMFSYQDSLLNRESTNEYISKEINLDISECVIDIDDQQHGGFHGDGYYYVRANCTESIKDKIEQVKIWKKLPLSENLQLIMYGGEKDGTNYGYKLALKVGIPEFQNGYYLFIDRQASGSNRYNDKDIFNRYSFNFTLALYDLDTNNFYYYEYDT